LTRAVTEAADFWSRRKARVAAEDAAHAQAAAAEARAAQEAAQEAAQAEKTDADLCAELNLPDPDTLEAGDDFTAFMKRAVPERLRRRALRRLWLSNPALANLDGMVDYGEDFTDDACVVAGMQTAYQVGKGMLAHVEDMARRAEAETADQDADQDTVEAPPAPEPVAEPAAIAPVGDAASQPAPAPAPGPQETETCAARDAAAPPPRRRMRFEFGAAVSGERA